MFRGVRRSQTFLRVGERLLQAHQLCFGILQLLSLRLDLIDKPRLFLLFPSQKIGGFEERSKLRLARMLSLHRSDLRGELLALLLQLLNVLLQFGGILRKSLWYQRSLVDRFELFVGDLELSLEFFVLLVDLLDLRIAGVFFGDVQRYQVLGEVGSLLMMFQVH